MRHMVVLATLVLAGCNPDGLRKVKTSQAEVFLERIARAAADYAAEKGAFPIGTAKQLPTNTGTGCCGGADNKCPVSPEFATDPVWSTLGFSIEVPSNFRLSYESKDGTSYVATAVGDLDCDGKVAQWTLAGSYENKTPRKSITAPPKGEY